MTAALRRGVCPTLAAPMPSGDGLLVRLALSEGLTPAQLAGLARAAAQFGNGLIEITARGSLQVRGVTAATAPVLATTLSDLGIAPPPGPPVLTGPLAGLDPTELADPRPLADALRRFDGALAPKVSVIVDGGGVLHLDAVPADVRLRATPDGWFVAVGGTAATARGLGRFDTAGAVAMGLALLDRLSRTRVRARALDIDGTVQSPPAYQPALPVGRFALIEGVARALALPFGQSDSGTLAALAAAARGAASLRPAPGRALIAVGLTPAADRRLLAAVEGVDLIADPADPRLAIVACAGAPACASALLRTRALAVRIAGRAPAGVRLHLSGCSKRCAQPGGPTVSLVGTPDGPAVTGEGAPVSRALRAFLLAQAGAVS